MLPDPLNVEKDCLVYLSLRCECFVTMKKFVWTTLLVTGILALLLFFANLPAYGAPTLSETVLTSDSDGATSGSFDGGGSTLTSTANLATTGSNRNYVAQYFVPSASGSYDIGLSSSTEDTVIVFYSGTFSSSSPSTNATTVQDDYSGARPTGVAMGTCGTQTSFCPQITETLVGGQTYYIVVTSYAPNKTVSDGVNLYIYGEPVSFGTASQATAENALANAVASELANQTQTFINLEKSFALGAIDRFVSSQNYFEGKENAKSNFAGSSTNKVKSLNLLADDYSVDLDGAFQNIKSFRSDLRTVVDSAFTLIDNKNGNRSEISNVRVALESFGQNQSTYGAAIGLHFHRTDVASSNSGVLENKGASASFYHVNLITDRLIIQEHIKLGFGRGRTKLYYDGQTWTNRYKTKTATLGFSLTGSLDTNLKSFSFLRSRKIRVYPTFALDYAVTKASNVQSKFIQGATEQSLDVEMPKTRVTNIFIAPKFKLPMVSKKFVRLGDAFTIAPGYSCRRLSALSSSNSCGLDLHLYSSQGKDGHKFFEVQFQNLDDTETLTGMLSLNFPIYAQPKTAVGSISAISGQKFIEKPFSYDDTTFSVESKGPLVDELDISILPKSPVIVSNRTISQSEERDNLQKHNMAPPLTKEAPADEIKWQINTSKKAIKNSQGSLSYPSQARSITGQPSTFRSSKSSMKVDFQFVVN